MSCSDRHVYQEAQQHNKRPESDQFFLTYVFLFLIHYIYSLTISYVNITHSNYSLQQSLFPPSHLCHPSPFQIPFLNPRHFKSVMWLAAFYQGCLCDHDCGAIHWSSVGSPVCTELSTMIPPLPEPTMATSSAVRGKVQSSTAPVADRCQVTPVQAQYRECQLMWVHVFNACHA